MKKSEPFPWPATLEIVSIARLGRWPDDQHRRRRAAAAAEATCEALESALGGG